MRSPMRNKFSVFVFVHADVESADGLTNFSCLQSELEVTSEPLKHRIWIELALLKIDALARQRSQRAIASFVTRQSWRH